MAGDSAFGARCVRTDNWEAAADPERIDRIRHQCLVRLAFESTSGSPVVHEFDVINDVSATIGSDPVSTSIGAFSLERTEEVINQYVAAAAADGAHRLSAGCGHADPLLHHPYRECNSATLNQACSSFVH